MSCPLLITSYLPPPSVGSIADTAMKILLGVASSGLACQVIGDTHKSIAKSRGKSLVTTGLYSFLRHPNYTGEAILWTASALVGLTAALATSKRSLFINALSIFSILGAIGEF